MINFHLTPQELTWLQRNLILHGIRQQYPSIRLKHSKAKSKEKKVPLPVRDLPRFLEYCCSYDPNARPTRDEVYAAYQNFCLSSTVETLIRFGKQLRALLSESLPNVEYKVARRQDLDGTALCYVGLNVKQDTAPSESPPPETVPSVPDTFRNLLAELEHFSKDIIKKEFASRSTHPPNDAESPTQIHKTRSVWGFKNSSKCSHSRRPVRSVG